MVKIQEAEEWEESRKLAMEKEVLGFIISVDPLKRYAHLMKYLSSFSLDKLKEYSDGATVAVAGIITGLKMSIIKNGRNVGKKMALFKIRTLQGTLSAVIFVKEYEAFRELIEDDRFLVFRGTLDLSRDEQGPSLKVTSAATVEDSLRENYSTLIVRLGALDRVDENRLEEIKAAAREYPGDSDLILSFDSGHRKTYSIKANARYGIDLGESSVIQMEKIAGKGNIELR
jgi:DNA polymerase-3 subunit alpha